MAGSFAPIRLVCGSVYELEQNDVLSDCGRCETTVSAANLPLFLGSDERRECVYVGEPVSFEPGIGTCNMLVSAQPFWHMCCDPDSAPWPRRRGIYREAVRTQSGIYVVADEDDRDWLDGRNVLFGVEAIPKDYDGMGGVSTESVWVPPADSAAGLIEGPAATPAAAPAGPSPPSAKRARRSASE